jgi:hypothetical protein
MAKEEIKKPAEVSAGFFVALFKMAHLRQF